MKTIELINILLEQRDCKRYQNLDDLFELLRIYEAEDQKHAHRLNKVVRDVSVKQSKNAFLPISERERFIQLYKRSLLFDAPIDFDAYLLYVEFDRRSEKKFYVPRRKTLRIVVQDMQDLHDGKIKLLAISLPPRVGKSTLGIFFMTWLMGKYPHKTSLMLGYGDKLAKGFYKEVQDIIDNEDYLWHDVFPTHSIKKRSADDYTLDIDKDSRYPTLTCRSVEGQLTGIVDIKCLLYADDLIEGIEEALNPERMGTKYGKYIGVVKDRKGDSVPELHIGTRWGVNDVIGKIKDQYDGRPEYRFRVIPALNENDESNFDYDKGRNPEWDKIGFSTEYYRDMKESHGNAGDMATWYAKYQGEPYVREGLVFPEKDLNTFKMKELPLGTPTVYMAVDVAWGGGDSLSAPIGYAYGDRIYIVDWVFNNGDKDETRPIIKSKIISHKITFTRFEANNGGGMYAESVDNDLREMGYRFAIESVTTTGGKNANKHAEILAYAPDIKKDFYFLDRTERTPEYERAMKELCRYVQNGKVKHDDSPDSLKQLAKMRLGNSCTYEVGDRPF